MDAADLKAQLADAIRMLERAGIIDHSGHGSVRRPAGGFYINTGASVRCTLTADDIVGVDVEGRLLEGEGKPPLECHLHAAIYRVRPDVQAVLHAHPRWSTLLTMTGTALAPVYAQGVLLGHVPVLDTPLSVNTEAMGRRVAETLGSGRAVLLKSHGAVVTGSDLVEAFALTTYLEENAHRQYLARQIGTPYEFSAEEQEACRRTLWSAALFRKSWDYFHAKS